MMTLPRNPPRSLYESRVRLTIPQTPPVRLFNSGAPLNPPEIWVPVNLITRYSSGSAPSGGTINGSTPTIRLCKNRPAGFRRKILHPIQYHLTANLRVNEGICDWKHLAERLNRQPRDVRKDLVHIPSLGKKLIDVCVARSWRPSDGSYKPYVAYRIWNTFKDVSAGKYFVWAHEESCS
jgi:hypothetical protein